MDLKKRIQQRIDYLKREEINAIKELDVAPANVVGSIHRAAKWELIRALHERRRELETMLAEDMREGTWPIHPVIPGSLVKLPTNQQELEAFHEAMIREGLTRFNIGAINESVQHFKNLQSYLVNVTATLWNEGLIEKLEFLEREDLGQYERASVDKWLHDAHQNRATLADNCRILETELNLGK